MDTYSVIKTVHILSATVLFGTGLGTAFFMLRSRYATELQSKYDIARSTVLADYLFTAPAGILQPLSGAALIALAEHDAMEMWLVISYGLFIVAGVCWLPVVWIQFRLRNLVHAALRTGAPLADEYEKLFRLWFALGWPAFTALTAIFFLMVLKPTW